MTGPSCLLGAFAALMIIIAICCAHRLVAGRRRHKNSEPDVDALHIMMGAAMAGMFEPPLNPFPGVVWQLLFGVTVAWFAWQAIRARARSTPSDPRPVHPLPHVVESLAMIYMLQPHGFQPGSHDAGMVMPAMSGPAGASSLVIPLALVLFMLGYIIWTADRLADMQLAPRLAASYKIAMSVAMGYMLITML